MEETKSSPYISIKGAAEHNLKDVSLEIPRNKLVVITGVSGSGKSSLAFDTIFAEGQRRYLESLSSYARQFLGMKEKPKVESIRGLSPVISIDQKSSSRNPRSTVATVTEIYDYLRLLYARIGVSHDPAGQPIVTMSREEIAAGVMALPADHKYLILAEIVFKKKGQFSHIPEIYQKLGFSRARVDGITYELDEFPKLNKNKPHTIEILVDRIINTKSASERISQSVQAGLEIAQGFLLAIDVDDNNKKYRFSQQYYNPDYPDFVPPEMEPRTFSFNNPAGACQNCMGLGRRPEIDPELIIPNDNLTISEGAIRPYNRMRVDTWTLKKMEAVAKHHGFSLRVKASQLKPDHLRKILYGTGNELYEMHFGDITDSIYYEGVIPWLERMHRETKSDWRRREIEAYMVEKVCHRCDGRRLKPEVLSVSIAGKSIAEVAEMTVDQAASFFKSLTLKGNQAQIAEPILREISARLMFLAEVGLNYLTLGRAANTLSGGEAQRIRLATQIGSGLQGVLYVLDEPSIGLHYADHQRLLTTLRRLRDLGNSLLVVEHDEDTIRQADFVVDVGPLAGVMGGQITALGTPQEIAKTADSLTGRYLSNNQRINTPPKRRQPKAGQKLRILGANQHNLKNIDVDIPLGVLVVVSGVSGSGKSTLINHILAAKLNTVLQRVLHTKVGDHKDILGHQFLDKIIVIDQAPIGRTPRSNPATYVGLYTDIRNLFSQMPLAKERGYAPGQFSFNVSGGRCEICSGEGAIKKEMHFLPDIFVTCEACRGKRYIQEVLEVHYKGKNIADILDMSIEEACGFFANLPAIINKLKTLREVGLGYMAIGQPATTLSGGEAQRIKLAKELTRRATGRTLYILDEPTTGLHMHDINQLLKILHTLVDNGNSMIVIEHNLDVIKNADWVIDMGPAGGAGGGEIVASGTPENVAVNKNSLTGKFLKPLLSEKVK